jgi:uncharacterized protein
VRLRAAGLALLGFWALAAHAQEVIPPSPPAHFNDYASLVTASTASTLDNELNEFERTTSNQIVVAIYPAMQSDSSIEDYTVRIAQAWHAGLKGRDNGAVLFIFAKTHQIYIQVGYGLEGKLTDALSKDIISDVIVPSFKSGDYDGGVTAGVHAILAATKGEYKGNGNTVAGHRSQGPPAPFIVFFVIVIVIISILRSRSQMYQSGGRRGIGGILPIILSAGGGGGGGFGGGGGGGGFSGGGGSFGGGGAGGSW